MSLKSNSNLPSPPVLGAPSPSSSLAHSSSAASRSNPNLPSPVPGAVYSLLLLSLLSPHPPSPQPPIQTPTYLLLLSREPSSPSCSSLLALSSSSFSAASRSNSTYLLLLSLELSSPSSSSLLALSSSSFSAASRPNYNLPSPPVPWAVLSLLLFSLGSLLILLLCTSLQPPDPTPTHLLLLTGRAARSEAWSPGMQAAPSLIPYFFCGDLVMKTFLRPFSLFRWFKKSSCQLLAKKCALSTGKLPRRLAQEQCG